ncbi:MAG: hypothetical protein AAFN74_13150 [Myxococcota bacterium]
MRTNRLLFLGFTLLTACLAEAESGPNIDLAPSQKARVNFLSGNRYVTLLAQGLNLEREMLCQELGQYRCVEDAHGITLMGVGPYRLGVHTPVDELGITAPIAVERIALNACLLAVRRDIESSPAARSFTGPPAAVVSTLYRRLLRREPGNDETEALVAMLDEVNDTGNFDGADARQTWTIAACLAVATSMEALFY